jgi:hypothetical protein
MHDYMEKAKFDKQNKLKMLANLIDHIPLKDLGIKYDDDLTSNEVRKNISKNLKNYIKDTGVVSKEEIFHIWAASFNITGPNNFEIINDFTRHEVSVTGLDGTAQPYYAYVSGASTITNFKVDFKY